MNKIILIGIAGLGALFLMNGQQAPAQNTETSTTLIKESTPFAVETQSSTPTPVISQADTAQGFDYSPYLDNSSKQNPTNIYELRQNQDPMQYTNTYESKLFENQEATWFKGKMKNQNNEPTKTNKVSSPTGVFDWSRLAVI